MNDILQTKEVAQLLDLTPDGVRDLAVRGELRCIRTSTGQRFYRRKDVEAVAAARQSARARRIAKGA